MSAQNCGPSVVAVAVAVAVAPSLPLGPPVILLVSPAVPAVPAVSAVLAALIVRALPSTRTCTIDPGKYHATLAAGLDASWDALGMRRSVVARRVPEGETARGPSALLPGLAQLGGVESAHIRGALRGGLSGRSSRLLRGRRLRHSGSDGVDG